MKNSGGETRTRCVTSCAGSTAFITIDGAFKERYELVKYVDIEVTIGLSFEDAMANGKGDAICWRRTTETR